MAEQHEPTHNLVSFSVDANADIDNDTMVAILYIQREGTQPKTLADEVNQTVNWGIQLAKAVPEVSVQTQTYNTNPVYKNGNLRGWRVDQSIRLESRDSTKLGELVGALQEKLAVRSLGYEVSAEARRKANEGLVSDAITRFSERADLIRRQLGRSSYRLVRMDINTSRGQPPRPMMRSMAMEADVARVAAPQIEAGTKEISVHINGTIELTDD